MDARFGLPVLARIDLHDIQSKKPLLLSGGLFLSSTVRLLFVVRGMRHYILLQAI
jgi:hypothetical protein